MSHPRVKFREGCCHFKLTQPLVSHPRVKFREGCCHFSLTHPFVGRAGVKFREGSGHSKLTHPLVSHPRVKFRGGSGHSSLTTHLTKQTSGKGPVCLLFFSLSPYFAFVSICLSRLFVAFLYHKATGCPFICLISILFFLISSLCQPHTQTLVV